MSRWRSAGAAVVVAAALLAPAEAGGSAAAPAAVSATGDPLRLVADTLVLPSSTLDGGVRLDARSVTLQADVLFAFGSARLDERGREAVAVAAEALQERRPRRVDVVGHTDARGSSAYNLALSRRRAEAVRRALEARLGGDGPALSAAGRGERRPVAANTTDGADDPRGRARNRRVELVPR